MGQVIWTCSIMKYLRCTDHNPMEWTLKVDEASALSAMRVADYLVTTLRLVPIHVIDALLVDTEITMKGRYAVLITLSDVNFPVDLFEGELSMPLLIFYVLISKNVALHYAWLRHLTDNMTAAVTHREYTITEQSVVVVNQWLGEIAGTACVISWISDVGRPDLRLVVLCASRSLHLAYSTHVNVQDAVASATQRPWVLKGSFCDKVARVVHDAQIPIIAVHETKNVDFVVGTAGLVCSGFDMVLLLILLLFSQEINLIDNECDNVPESVQKMIRTMRHASKGVQGLLPFVHEISNIE